MIQVLHTRASEFGPERQWVVGQSYHGWPTVPEGEAFITSISKTDTGYLVRSNKGGSTLIQDADVLDAK